VLYVLGGLPLIVVLFFGLIAQSVGVSGIEPKLEFLGLLSYALGAVYYILTTD
jgi:hypothetical protein